MSVGNLVTGATGFLGSALTLELLARTDQRMALLVRDSAQPPADRVLAALRRAAQDHGYPEDFVNRNRDRLDVVAGDLDADPTGAAPALGPVARAWHCAASLRYEDSHRDEIWHTNVEGTKKALELARRCGAAEFHHISTAYVAGTREGIVAEAPVEAPTNNAYETSKVGGEQLVGAERAMRTRIYRPSIVVGHSHTRETASNTGLYGFLGGLVRFRRMAQRRLGIDPEQLTISLVADPGAPLNFVPIDVAVAQAVDLADHEPDHPIVHLTNARPPTVGTVIDLIFDEVGLPRPRYVGSSDGLAPLDARFDAGMTFYRSYICGRKTFSQDLAARHGRELAFDFEPDVLTEMYRAYLRRYHPACTTGSTARSVLSP